MSTSEKTTSRTPQSTFVGLREKLLGGPGKPANTRVLIVAIGDSVTLGLATNPELLHERTYHARLRVELTRDFPQTAFSTVNAGVNGDSSTGGRRRFQHDVLDHHPDLAIIAFGLNDSGAGEDGLPAFMQNLREMVELAHAAGTAVILMTPNWMATHDNGHVDPNFRRAFEPIIERQRSGILGSYAAAVRQVGEELGAPVADVYAQWECRTKRGKDMTAHLANGLNHPDAYGHRIACKTLMQTLRTAISLPVA